jgi:RHS repeat-associated protein
MAEERDVNNKITKRYFDQGEQRINAGVPTSYYYTFDYLGSVREMVDSSGTIQARYSYDPYGRATQISGPLSCDFQYAGMYEHATSGLNLTQFRAYNPNLGRWLSRDPLGESEGLNLYAYCNGDPINNIDPLGTSIVGKVIVQGLKYGRKIFGKKLSLKEAGDALKDGEDILASNRGQAQKIAQAGSEPGKAPIYEVDKSTGKPHYHPNPRTGGHVVWGISELGSAASYFTVSHYANELNGAGYSSSFSSGVQDYAYAVDLVNPLSVFQDITDIASTVGGGDSGDSVPEQTAPESTSDGSDPSDSNCIDNPPIDPTSIPAPWQM